MVSEVGAHVAAVKPIPHRHKGEIRLEFEQSVDPACLSATT